MVVIEEGMLSIIKIKHVMKNINVDYFFPGGNYTANKKKWRSFSADNIFLDVFKYYRTS